MPWTRPTDRAAALEVMDHVRRRPGMYFGRATGAIVVSEIVDVAVRESLCDRCSSIGVIIHADSSVTITDDSPGLKALRYLDESNLVEIPQEMSKPFDGYLNNWHPVDTDPYPLVGGLHGLDWLPAVVALSTRVIFDLSIEGVTWRAELGHEAPVAQARKTGTADNSGMSVTLWIDESVVDLDVLEEVVLDRLLRLSQIRPETRIEFCDERVDGLCRVFDAGKGMAGRVAELAGDTTTLGPLVRTVRVIPDQSRPPITLDIAFQWCDDDDRVVEVFANTIPVVGKTGSGLAEGIATGLTSYARRRTSYLTWKDGDLRADACAGGLRGAISILMSEPIFRSPTRSELANPEIEHLIAWATHTALDDWLPRHPGVAATLIERARRAALPVDEAGPASSSTG